MKIITLDNIDEKSVPNIVFDWGGVITNINYTETIKAFNDLGFPSFSDFFAQNHQIDLFTKLETGIIAPKDFYREIRRIFKKRISDQKLESAWCRMLLDTPIARIDLLNKLKENHALYLLSNTNIIHSEYYIEKLKTLYHLDFRLLFRGTYFSHELGMRKPNRKIFEYILDDNHLSALNTLYVDDLETNANAASLVGMIALHLTEGNTIEKIFKQWEE